ncbi:MAG TPA: hypothetical protein VES19_11965 [Candidatus Limnocylindrales bacterium]|nr:hypothetical protein [Candidatus Limnocylindrales bacterium]
MPEPLAAELRSHELAESPEDRAARLANLRWLTARRLWAAMDRAGINEDGARIRFIGERLWPELPPDTLEGLVAAVRERSVDGVPLVRPLHARDIVGERLEGLMRQHGYDTRSPDRTGPSS